MGVRILHDEDDKLANLYCSTSDWAFGPVFYADGVIGASDFAEAFLKWMNGDVRDYDDETLEMKYCEFQRLNWKECPECYLTLIRGEEKMCDECKEDKINEAEEERCKPISHIKITKEFDEEEVSLCPKCFCMTHTLRDNICGKCKEEKTK